MIMIREIGVVLLGLALAGCGGVSVQFGDMQPLPGFDELLSAEAAINVEVVSYRYDCGTQGPETRVSLLPDKKSVETWEAERQFQLLQAGQTLEEGSYAMIELGARETGGDGFAVSRAGGRKGNTALIKITGMTFSSQPQGEGPASPCALVALPAGKWERIRLLDQVSGLKITSPPLR